jgi:rubrerythrin
MLSSLVNRYLNEGEAMLADTDIWVCTVCGFVYIGETPPELCPVCKDPPYKFEKIEGRA